MQVVILGSGSPLPSPDRPAPPPWSAPRPATCCSTPAAVSSCGRPAALSGAVAFRAAVPDPPAQRPHHRPQRRHHHPVGDVLRPEPAHRLRPGRARPPGGGHRGHAGARHRLPAGPPRGPRLAPGHRGDRRDRGRGLRGGRRPGDGRAHRPRPGAPHRGLPGRRRGRGRWSSPGTPCPARGSTGCAPGPTSWCTRWSAATRSRRWAAPAARRPRLPLVGARCRAGPRPAPGWAPWCSPTWSRPSSPGPSRSGSTRQPANSTGRWSCPRTSRPSRSARSFSRLRTVTRQMSEDRSEGHEATEASRSPTSASPTPTSAPSWPGTGRPWP